MVEYEYLMNTVINDNGKELKRFIYNKSTDDLKDLVGPAIKDFNKQTAKYIRAHLVELKITDANLCRVRHSICTHKNYSKNEKSFIIIEPNKSIDKPIELTPEMLYPDARCNRKVMHTLDASKKERVGSS